MSEQEKPKNQDDQLLEMAKELPEVPSFYKYRDIAKTMMDHNMFIKSDKGLQWQIDDLALKLEHCKTLQIPMTWANSLYIGNGKFGMEIDLMSWIVRTQCPDAQFVLDHGDDKECVIMGRRTLINPNAPWRPFKYTIEMAKANNLIRGSNWLLNPANMINKNAYANAYRGLCRAELQNSYIKEEIGADEEKPFQPLPDVPDRVVKQTKKADILEKPLSKITENPPATKDPPHPKKTVDEMLKNDPLEKLKEFDNRSDAFADAIKANPRAVVKDPEKLDEEIASLLNAPLPEDGLSTPIEQEDGSRLFAGIHAEDYISKDGSNKSYKIFWNNQPYYVPKTHAKLTDQGLIVSKWWFEKNREKMGL